MTILDKMNRDMRTSDTTLESEKDNRQVFISIDNLEPSKKNEKILIVDDGLKETIRDDGLLTPLLVMRKDNGKYEIISGNRRYTAIKSLLKDDSTFRYKWKGKTLRDPKHDGIPCNVVDVLSDVDKTLFIIGANKVRDYDKLELYRSVLELRDVYNTLKENGKLKYGEGRMSEWLAARLPLSERTISDILTDKWIINSKNYSNIVDSGSFEKYNKSTERNEFSGKALPEQPKLSKYDKEWNKLTSIDNHYSKFKQDDFEQHQLDEMKHYAITIIGIMMDAFDINGKELH